MESYRRTLISAACKVLMKGLLECEPPSPLGTEAGAGSNAGQPGQQLVDLISASC